MRPIVLACWVLAACDGNASGGGEPAGNPPTDQAPPSGVSPDVLARCEGAPLAQDGVLDLALQRIELTGVVTLEGQPLPGAEPLGALTFVHADTGATASVALVPGVPYVVTLTPGEYDVGYVPPSSVCAPGDTMPCIATTLRERIALRTDGVLDFDLSVVTIRGAVTLRTQPLPEERDQRGSLSFAQSGSIAFSDNLGDVGNGLYEIRLVPGAYDVGFVANAALCARGAPTPNVPCVSGEVRRGLTVRDDGVFDVDLEPYTLSGTITIDGAPMGDASAPRGGLRIAGSSDESTSAAAYGSFAFGESGPADYALRLLPGEYDLTFEANPTLCDKPGAPAPCVSAPLAHHIAVRSDGVLDLDLPTIEVSGTVTLGGEALPSSPNLGGIAFAHDDGGVAYTMFAAEDGGRYSLRLVAGHYAISYLAPQGLPCTEHGPMPCVTAELRRGAIAASGVLDLDIPFVVVSGALTVHGQPMNAERTGRGSLTIARDAGLASSEPFGASGEARYGAVLVPGRYTFGFAPAYDLCDGEAAPGVPCGATELSTIEALASGVFDLDMRPVRITGQVTIEGGPFETDEPGSLTFSELDREAFASVPIVGSRYAITLMPGRYVASHVPAAYACDGVTADTLPCNSSIVWGCP